MKIDSINFSDIENNTLSVRLDADGDFYFSIGNNESFFIKPSEWDSFIEKLQQAKQLLQQQEDESDNK